MVDDFEGAPCGREGERRPLQSQFELCDLDVARRAIGSLATIAILLEDLNGALEVARRAKEPCERAQGGAVRGFDFEDAPEDRDRPLRRLECVFLEGGPLREQIELLPRGGALDPPVEEPP